MDAIVFIIENYHISMKIMTKTNKFMLKAIILNFFKHDRDINTF